MSTISEAIRRARQVELLLELDFGGPVKRYATKEIRFSDRVFNASLLKPLEIRESFDFRTMRYSQRSVAVELANKARFQDEEMRNVLDGGIGRIYVWAPGLAWSDISENGLIFTGVFQKDYHSKEQYGFKLEEIWDARSKTIPSDVINLDTWPHHRTWGGAGSVAGKTEPLVFGDWPKGMPLRCVCVQIGDYKYMAYSGVSRVTDSQYTAGTYDVMDKDGVVIDPANYVFYPGGLDSKGNICAYFQFTVNQAASEPLSCSIQGLMDGEGEITGSASGLIEHPAEIIHYLILNHSGFGASGLHRQSLKTMKNVLAGMNFACIINTQAGVEDIIGRIGAQCLSSPLVYGDLAGMMTLSTTIPAVKRLNTTTQAVKKTLKISRTPKDEVHNNIKVRYGLNPTTGQYEEEITKNRLNDSLCKLSVLDYGESPLKVIDCPDVQDGGTAHQIAARVVELKAYRHDLIEVDVPYWEGIDQQEGDAAELTVEEGPSRDGAGWTNERCILIERSFMQHTIKQTWWRPANFFFGKLIYLRTDMGEYIKSDYGEAIVK